ncbi:MAG: DUF503 domain-containing protein [Actinomycetota bacterium]|nr:DUF503 domain-containing protein [Actinomycetota bacterium]
MFVGVARFELRLPDCASLKDKRSVLRRLISLIRQKFNVSAGEVDHLDLWQRSTVAVSLISDTQFHARRVLQEIERHVETHPGVELLDTATDFISPE